MNKTTLAIACLATFVATGCAGTEEYEVSGQVTSVEAVSGPITVEFFEEADDERTSIKKITLETPGEFSETLEASSDASLVALALVDSDGDGVCSDGELWAEQVIDPSEEGATMDFDLELASTACPDAQPAE